MRLLFQTLRSNQDTAYGKRYDFGSIKSLDHFQNSVPIISYEAIRGDIDRMAMGEGNVLHSGSTVCFEPTSGTTCARKLIPYNAALKHQFSAAINAWLYHQFCTHPATMNGSAYWSISPPMHDQIYTTGGIPIGFEEDSQYLNKAGALLAKHILAVPTDVAKLRTLEDFRYATLFYLLRSRNLAFISIWNPTFLSLLIDSLQTYWDQLLADIHSGSIHLPSNKRLPWRNLPADKARANELKNHASETSKLLHGLWPKLAGISCWADAAAAKPCRNLMCLFPQATLLPKGLLSTEGVVSIPVGGINYPVLAGHVHFFEFIHTGTGKLYTAWQLCEGERYEVLLTTAGGLYRYQTGDSVRVNGFLAEAPLLQFTGRLGNCSDLCGEKLTEAFVTQCLSQAGLEGCLVKARSEYPLRYELIIPSDCDSVNAGERLEKLLCENYHYQHCRKLGQLAPLDVQHSQSTACDLQKDYTYSRQSTKQGDIKPVALIPTE